MKRALGANTLLGITVAYNRLKAAIEGKPSWLVFREAGQELTQRGMTFDDEKFYEPVVRSTREISANTKIQPHKVFGASARDV